MSASKEQKAQILTLLDQQLSCREIADKLGIGIMVVAGFKAALTRSNGHAENEVADALETTFGLERNLQEALRFHTNIEQLEHGLKITDGGKEQAVSTGRIDISAQDANGNLVVIELKAGIADRETIGQILGYMGALKKDPTTPVRGIIVAGDFDPAAVAALNVQPNLQLKKYTFNFSFESVSPEKR